MSTYLDSPEDPVTLDVRFAQLADGASYAERLVLEAPAKQVSVSVENSGYRPSR